jgi:hypothetical protein
LRSARLPTRNGTRRSPGAKTAPLRFTCQSEIATDCFDVDLKDGHALGDRILVTPAEIVRALESAYDMSLIAGYRLTHGTVRLR